MKQVVDVLVEIRDLVLEGVEILRERSDQDRTGADVESNPIHDPIPLDPLRILRKAAEFVGLDEEDDADEINGHMADNGIDIDVAHTAWCAAFINMILAMLGMVGTGTLRARDFADWGEECDLEPGCIIVYKSHVGICTEDMKCLGGNQSDGITVGEIAWYGKPIAYRRVV